MSALLLSIVLSLQVQPENPTLAWAGTVGKDELIRIAHYGGLTPRGPAKGRLLVKSDGSVSLEDQDGIQKAQLSKVDLTYLRDQLNTTNYKALREFRNESGTRPSAYDGSDIVMALRTKDGIQRWSNFEYKQNPKVPLFWNLKKLLDKYKVKSWFLTV